MNTGPYHLDNPLERKRRREDRDARFLSNPPAEQVRTAVESEYG